MSKCPKLFSEPLPGSEKEGSSPIYRHIDFVSKLKVDLDDAKDVKTLWALFANAAQRWPKALCHGVREIDPKTGKAGPFKFNTYADVLKRINHVASGLKPYLKKDTSGTMNLCAIMGINSPEWSIAELSCMAMSGTTVPLYSTTPKETMEFLLNQNGCSVIVCDPASVKVILSAKPALPKLVTIIVYKLASDKVAEVKAQAEGLGMEFLTFAELEAKGEKNPLPLDPPKPTDVFSFIYTSGSTGMPKGALLTHEAQISVLAGAFHDTDKSGIKLKRGGGEFHLSYLPSAHVMERAFQANLYSIGGAVGYFQGKREELVDDLKNLRPTVWPSVPRLLNLIYDKIMNTVRAAGGVKQKLFNKALDAKIANLRKGKMTHAMWDALVFKKIRKGLGLDRLSIIVTGSAPIAGAVLDFYRAVFRVYMIEGYGATETCASGTLTHPLFFSSEHVGGPSPNIELKLVSLPQMNYLVTDTQHGALTVKGRGEICMRGLCIMREYYLNPEATSKAIDDEKWYHTGDVGCILPTNSFKIFDRVGNVFKLSIGEYVAPEKIENICLRSALIASVFAHGDNMHPKMIAVVVPDEASALAWGKENNVSGTYAELCKNEAFRQAIIKDMDVVGRKNGLQSYEIPKDVFLDSVPWTPENLLTGTQKMQRKKALEFYKTQIEAMLGAPS